MSLEEVEPLAEMEERELSNYGATELVECNDGKNNDGRYRGGQTDFVENRCWFSGIIGPLLKRQLVTLSQKKLSSY